MYYDNNGFHLLVYTFNSFGQPLSGIQTQFAISASNGSGYSATGTTNSSGYSYLTLKAPQNLTGQASYNATLPSNSQYGQPQFNFPIPVFKTIAGQVLSFGDLISPVVDASDTSKYLPMVFFVGPYGSLPINYSVYYEVCTGNFGTSCFPQKSGMTLLGSLKDYHQTYDLKLPISAVTKSVEIAIFTSNGTLVEGTTFSASQFLPQTPNVQAIPIVTSFIGGTVSLFVPLMAILASYSSYGRDRISGVLESVLARPVSRRDLAFSRYVSIVLVLGLSTVATVLVADLIVKILLDSFLDPVFVLSTMGALVVEAAAFVGLMLFFSHLLRSTGALIGVGIGLFVLFDVLWSLVVYLAASAMGILPGSENSFQVLIASDFLNPAQFSSLVSLLITGTFQGIGGGFSMYGFNLSTFGLTVPSLVATAILWIGIPFLLFLYLAVKRD